MSTERGVWLSADDGRMGGMLARLLADSDPAAEGLRRTPNFADSAVVIDYSHPGLSGPLLERLIAAPRALMIGTTGLDEALEARLRELATKAPVVYASNTGTGIQVLRQLVRQAVTLLGPGWDAEIVELHHREKVDAPSGTAWTLLEEIGDRRRAVAARVGQVGERTDEEIGVQTLRGGDVVGEHTVYLIGHGERIELTHRCWDRATFARGGLRAARWLCAPNRAPGLYDMSDVLGS